MGEPKGLEFRVLRELRSTQSLSELNSKQRKDLHQFCKTWADVFTDLDMLEEKSFEELINDALKGKSDKEIEDWYFHEIVDREQILSLICSDQQCRGTELPSEVKKDLKQELRSLRLRAFGFSGMHFHTIESP